MRKFVFTLVTLGFVLFLTACGGGSDNKLVVGATNEPHAVILEQAKPLLEEEGIELEVITFTSYGMINQALVEGDLDANYFQHIPYLEAEIEEKGYDIVNAGGIHIEPIGIYSQKYDSLEELPDGAKILISNNFPDHGRILGLFEKHGLIKIKEGVDKTAATLDDIAENPKNLQFEYDYAPELMPQLYLNGEGDAVVINSNYAIDAGINPLEDSIVIEESDSPYVNVIAVNKGDEEREDIRKLVEVLHSAEIQQFILDEWGGAVVPVQ